MLGLFAEFDIARAEAGCEVTDRLVVAISLSFLEAVSKDRSACVWSPSTSFVVLEQDKNKR